MPCDDAAEGEYFADDVRADADDARPPASRQPPTIKARSRIDYYSQGTLPGRYCYRVPKKKALTPDADACRPHSLPPTKPQSPPPPIVTTADGRPLCRLCSTRIADQQRRGLCSQCRKSPERQKVLPPGAEGFEATAKMPPEWTSAEPGSEAKIVVMQLRAAAGFAVFHPWDRRTCPQTGVVREGPPAVPGRKPSPFLPPVTEAQEIKKRARNVS